MVDLSDLPISPGVYIFRNSADEVIYIGKAINLRSRVRSYWHEKNWKERPKLAVLVPQINRFETIITKNEKEALILEANLVYEHQPKYNVLLKDNNRSFPWIAITYGEPFPRLIPVREVKWLKRKYPLAKMFGPYTDIGAMYKTLAVCRELFPLRKRVTPHFRDRPCLNYHIGQCLGPCQGLVSEEEYDELLKQVEMFLAGKHQALVEQLQIKMEEASQELYFERAAKYRDQIKLLMRTLESQRIVTDDPDCERDIIGYAFNETDFCVQIFKMREGKLVGRESYLAELNEVQTLGESLESVVEQAYLLRQPENIPPEILLQNQIDGLSLELSEYKIEGKNLSERFETMLSTIAGRNVKTYFPKRGEKKEQIELASYNAKQELESKEKQKAKSVLALSALQKALDLPVLPNKIDCFDISHLQGTEVVASCVRFQSSQPDKSKYRKFKIAVDQNNDFLAMKEAVFRRYYRSRHNKEVDLPDLIVIDGGKGQLSSALEALRDLGHEDDVEMISLAKKEEEIFRLDGTRIELPKNAPALQLLQRVRDEAHRFAVTFNRQRREKSSKRSLVDEIPGVGSVIKEKIMKRFTVKELLEAPPQELNQKLGIGAKRADKLWQSIRAINPNVEVEPDEM
ncbi:MAG: excinuclease ABC subunit UvrC [Candidatus Caenarcaniphilales bacterium]|nr:excinuclease ABC subunit UvrC [Candidatus Caenarcaniphilales bacterium]